MVIQTKFDWQLSVNVIIIIRWMIRWLNNNHTAGCLKSLYVNRLILEPEVIELFKEHQLLRIKVDNQFGSYMN